MPRPDSVFTNPVPRGSSSPNRFGPFALRAWLFAEGEQGCRKLPRAVRSWVGGGSRGTRGAAFCVRVQRGGKTRQQSWRRMERDQGEGAEGRGGSGETEVCSNVRGWYGTLAGTGLALPWQWVGACPSLWSCPVHKALHDPSHLQPHASIIPATSQELAVKSELGS